MGFFNNIFSSKKDTDELLHALDMSIIKTDLHSHLLPGIDDGSTSIEESIELVKALIKMGYSRIITTPHIINDYFKNTPEIIHAKLAELKTALINENITIDIVAAAEYLVDESLEEKIKNNTILSFGEKKYVLIELPFFNPPQNLKNVIFNLEINEYKVVLAHPERYLYWANQLDNFEELKDRNVLFQSNLLSFTNYYSKESKILLEKLISKNMIDFVGSDLHQTKYLDYTIAALKTSTLHQLANSGRLLNHTL